MQQILFIVLSVLGTIGPVFSQNKLIFGLRTAIQVSHFYNRIGEYGQGEPNIYDNDMRFSGSLGAFLNLRANSVVSFQVETCLSGRGGGYTTIDPKVITHVVGKGFEKSVIYKNYGLNYLELPLSVKFNVNQFFGAKDEDKIAIFLSAGMGPSFLITSTFIWNTYVPSGYILNQVDENRNWDYFPHANKKIFNIHGAIGFGLREAFVEFRYTSSTGNVYDTRYLHGYSLATGMGTLSINFFIKLVPWRYY